MSGQRTIFKHSDNNRFLLFKTSSAPSAHWNQPEDEGFAVVEQLASATSFGVVGEVKSGTVTLLFLKSCV